MYLANDYRIKEFDRFDNLNVIDVLTLAMMRSNQIIVSFSASFGLDEALEVQSGWQIVLVDGNDRTFADWPDVGWNSYTIEGVAIGEDESFAAFFIDRKRR